MFGAAVTAEASERLRDPSEAPTSPRGSSGRSYAYGSAPAILEPNTRLRALSARIPAFVKAQMHPAVCAGRGAFYGLMRSATFSVQPAGDEALALDYAEHVAENLGLEGYTSRAGRSWEALLAELLTPIDLGFGIWELTTYDADGHRWTVPEWRAPESVAHWVVDQRDRMVAVVQQPDTGRGWVTIPAAYLLHLAYDSRGSSLEGQGILRGVEPLTRDSVTLENLQVVSAQRWAVGTPVIRFDAELYQQLVPDGSPTAEQSKWEDIGRKYCSGERAYFFLPPWVTLDTFGGTFADYPMNATIDALYRRILTQYLSQHLALGTEGGSYALGQTHASIQAQRAANDLEWVCDGLKSLIHRMCLWQFGEVNRDLLPVLRFDGIRSPLFTERFADIVSAIGSGLITPTDGDEAALRLAYEMPPLPDGVGRDIGARLRGTARSLPRLTRPAEVMP